MNNTPKTVEEQLREDICKPYTKPYSEMSKDLQYKVDEMVRLCLPLMEELATENYKQGFIDGGLRAEERLQK